MINTTSDMKVIRSLHIEEDLKMATYYLAVDIGASADVTFLDIWKTEKWFWKKFIVLRMEW